MTNSRSMYLGTATGVTVLVEDEGHWREERSSLDGKAVEVIVASDAAGMVFAGVPGDGVYASSDRGVTWDRSLSGDVRSLALDPSNPAVVYAGTEPVRLYRTSDAGDSWSEIEALQLLPDSVKELWWFPNYPHAGHVLSIYVDPRDGRHLYLGIEHGGIVRTEDGGASWDDLTRGIEYIDVHAVVGDPNQQNVVYATTARGFYCSENYGQDWALSVDGITRDYMHECLVRPGAASTVFMTTANGSPPSWLREGGAEAAIYRSTDTCLSWQQVRGGLPESATRMVCSIAADPEDPDRVYAGLSDHHHSQYVRKDVVVGSEVWTSGDRGDTWTQIYESSTKFAKLAVALG